MVKCVVCCKCYKYEKNCKISFYTIPKDPEIQQKWLSVCKKSKEFKSHDRVCSKHFDSSDYMRDLRNELLDLPARKFLRPDAVPHLNLPDDDQVVNEFAKSKKDFSDVNDAGDDNAFLHSMEASEIEIDVDPEFETVDIKPNILLDNLPPLPPSPVPTKRRKRNSDQLETASSAAGKRSKSDQSCDFGDDDGDDDYQPDSGDDFDSEEDSAKVRRAYDLLKSVFDKKDKYDIFCNRLAGRLRGLKSPKVCRHVQQLLVTVVADAEAGRYDNVPG